MASLQKKSLKKKAKENTNVTIGTSNNQNTLKNGVPNDHSVKHLSGTPIVGLSIGSTINMDNYESLRVDCWLTDTVDSNESFEQAYRRLNKVITTTLNEVVNQYTSN